MIHFIRLLTVSANLMSCPFRERDCASAAATSLLLSVALMMGAVPSSHAAPAGPEITVAAYYYPCEHPDPRWDKAKYPGFTEWDLVRKAKPRFPGHKQPKVPLWGYTDESDPKVMAQKIDAAANYGVHAFIFDWYYYNDGPYLQAALDRGFLQATNNSRIKFGLMWANHDWFDIQGYNPADNVKLLYPGKVTPATWDKITDLVIARYFKHPSYWKIDGKPYFSIYEMGLFLESFGQSAGVLPPGRFGRPQRTALTCTPGNPAALAFCRKRSSAAREASTEPKLSRNRLIS